MRRHPYRRECPKFLAKRIAHTLEKQLFIVHESGPLAFIVREEHAENVGNERSSKPDVKFKVTLGTENACSCPSNLADKENCVHILWILLKRFRVPKESDLLYQKSLVEREVSDIMKGKLIHAPYAPRSTPHAKNHGAPEMEQRPLSEGDICPICQENFVANDEPLTWCRTAGGCRNSFHVKCMKMVADYQSNSMGAKTLLCPLCRTDMGAIEDVKRVLNDAPNRIATRAERKKLHLGFACRTCHTGPISNRCHRCINCPEYYLCDTCFLHGMHEQHSFEYRDDKKNVQWKPSIRPTTTILPENLISDLHTRELTADDYEMLLQLDQPPPASTLAMGIPPLQAVNSFPTRNLKKDDPLLKSPCKVCLKPHRAGDLVRRIPCAHSFHQMCIDRWLLRFKSTCPTCNLEAYSDLRTESGGDSGIDLASATYRVNQYPEEAISTTSKTKKKKKSAPSTSSSQPNMSLIVSASGSSIFDTPSQLSTISLPSVVPRTTVKSSIAANPYNSTKLPKLIPPRTFTAAPRGSPPANNVGKLRLSGRSIGGNSEDADNSNDNDVAHLGTVGFQNRRLREFEQRHITGSPLRGKQRPMFLSAIKTARSRVMLQTSDTADDVLLSSLFIGRDVKSTDSITRDKSGKCAVNGSGMERLIRASMEANRVAKFRERARKAAEGRWMEQSSSVAAVRDAISK